MSFDPKVTWAAVVTFLAVVSSWLIPFVLERIRRHRRRDAIKKSIAMYLDALQIKISVAINRHFVRGIKVPSGKESFEAQNKSNHDALEKLFVSEELESADRLAVERLLRYVKTSPIMKLEEDFREYLAHITYSELRSIFYKSSDLDSTILCLLNKKETPNDNEARKTRSVRKNARSTKTKK